MLNDFSDGTLTLSKIQRNEWFCNADKNFSQAPKKIWHQTTNLSLKLGSLYSEVTFSVFLIVLKWGGVALVPKYFGGLRKVFVWVKKSLSFWILSRFHLKDLITRFLKQVLLFEICVEVLSDPFNLIHTPYFHTRLEILNKISVALFWPNREIRLFCDFSPFEWNITKLQLLVCRQLLRKSHWFK